MQAAPESYSNKREMRDAPASPAPPRAASEASSAGRLYAEPSLPLGTGHGRREESQARLVDFERATPQPVETITIHYDSHQNLVARGVIVAARAPQAFPGFVPDPPASWLF
jgi:hypothetical protein